MQTLQRFLWDRLGLLRLIDTKICEFITDFFPYNSHNSHNLHNSHNSHNSHKINENRKYIYYESESLAKWCINNKMIYNRNVAISAIKHTQITREKLFPIDYKLLKHIIRNGRIDIIQELSGWIFDCNNTFEILLFKIAFLENPSENLQKLFLAIFKEFFPRLSFGKTDQDLIKLQLEQLSDNNINIKLNPSAVNALLVKYPSCLYDVIRLFANYQFHIQSETRLLDFDLLPMSNIHLYTIIMNGFKFDPLFNEICQRKDSYGFDSYFLSLQKIPHYSFLLFNLAESVTDLLLKIEWFEPFIKCRKSNNLKLTHFKPTFKFKKSVPMSNYFLKHAESLGANHKDVFKQLLINDDITQMDYYLSQHSILLLEFEHYEYCSFKMFQHLKQEGYVVCDFSNTVFTKFSSKYDQEWVDFLLYFFILKDHSNNYSFASLFAHLTHFLKTPKDQQNSVDIKIIGEMIDFVKHQDHFKQVIFSFLENFVPIYRGFFDIIVNLPNFCLYEHCDLLSPFDLETLRLLKAIGSNNNFDCLNIKNRISQVISFDAFNYMKDNGFVFDNNNVIDVLKSLKKTDEISKIVFLYEKKPTINLKTISTFVTPEEIKLIKMLYSP